MNMPMQSCVRGMTMRWGGAKTGGAAAAEAVGESHGLDVDAGIQGVESLLERDTQLVGIVVKTHFEPAGLRDVPGPARKHGDFVLENRAGQQSDARRRIGGFRIVHEREEKRRRVQGSRRWRKSGSGKGVDG